MSINEEDDEKERLTSEEFADLIPHLDFKNVLQIEYFITQWKKLIDTTSQAKFYFCNLCKIRLSGQKSVDSHIGGKKHLGNMEDVKYLYHSQYTFTKEQLQGIEASSAADSNKNENKDSKESKAAKENVVTSKPPATAQKSSENKVATPAGPKSAGSVNKTNQTPNKSAAVPNAKKITGNEKQATTNQPTQPNLGKNVEQKKESPKPVQVQQKSETTNKTDTKSSQDTSKTSSNTEMNKKLLNNRQAVVRLVPIDKLIQKNSEAEKNKTLKVEVKKEPVGATGSPNASDNKNKSTSATGNPNASDNKNKSTGSINLNLKSKTTESKESVQTEKAITEKPNQKPNDSKNKTSTQINESTSQKKPAETLNSKNQRVIPDNKTTEPKKTAGETNNKNVTNVNSANQIGKTVENPNKNEATDSSRKLVKNPLAGQKSKQEVVAEKSQDKSSENAENAVVIVIDDNDDESQSKNNTEATPPAKKARISIKLNVSENQNKNENQSKNNTQKVSSEIQIPQNQNKGIAVSKSNTNIILLKDNTGPVKRPVLLNDNTAPVKKPIILNDNTAPVKKPEKSKEPAFATKSVTDTAGDKIRGFVGVEYLIKITRGNMNEYAPRYECGLCELVLDGQSMQNHLLGYNHRLKFCEKHFPTAIQQFRQYILNVAADEHYKVMIPVLEKLTVAIEEHHGRSLPFECDERRYNSERHRVLTEVFGRRHASEQKGPTFTHVVDSKQVDEYILQKDTVKPQQSYNSIMFDKREAENANRKKNQDNRRAPEAPRRSNHNSRPYQTGMQPNTIYPFDNSNNFVDDETHKRMVDNFLNKNNISSKHNSSRSSRNDKDVRRGQPSKRPHSPTRMEYGSKRETHVSLNTWSSYCRLVDSNLKLLKDSFQQYRANPESHPSYREEWLQFWHRRKSDLMARGIDYRTYDFQPDWVPYFNNRINELYDEAFEKLKIQAREELFLPMTNNYLLDPKYFVHVKSDNYCPPEKRVATSSSMDHMIMPPISSQMNIDAPFSHNIIKEREKAPHTLEKEPVNIAKSNPQPKPKDMEIQDDSTPTVVSVLRLLTALEEYLGSLGPKIVELLSKALQAEKLSQGRAYVLLTEENCTLLETAMEKFKGLVIAGLLDTPKERALKKAISKINTLLDYTKDVREAHPSIKEPENVSNAPVPPKISNIDSRTINEKPVQNINEKLKQALHTVSNANDISNVIHLIEEKISSALKAQGRTDVDRAHLEQLAAVCVLLEKKKREVGGLEKQDVAAHKPTLQQPLSDALKKIVGSLGGNSSQQGGSKQHESLMQRQGDNRQQESLLQRSGRNNQEEFLQQRQGVNRQQESLMQRPGRNNQEEFLQQRQGGNRQQEPLMQRPGGNNQEELLMQRRGDNRQQESLMQRPGRNNQEEFLQQRQGGNRQQEPLMQRPGGNNQEELLMQRQGGNRQQESLRQRPGASNQEEFLQQRQGGNRQQEPLMQRPGGNNQEELLMQRRGDNRQQESLMQRPGRNNQEEFLQQRQGGSRQQESLMQRPGGNKQEELLMQRRSGNRPQDSLMQRSGGNKQPEPLQKIPTVLNNKRMTPSALELEARPIENIASQNPRMPSYKPVNKIGEINNYKGNQQGNFSNLHNKNSNQIWTDDNSSFGPNAQPRSWQQQQPQPQQPQQNMMTSFGRKHPHRVWTANEGTSAPEANPQRGDYQSSFGGRPAPPDQYRYNY